MTVKYIEIENCKAHLQSKEDDLQDILKKIEEKEEKRKSYLAEKDTYTKEQVEVEAELKANNIRCSVDQRSEKMGYKIREARLNRVPYLLIVGAKEEEEQKVSVRSRYLGDEGSKDLGEFIEAIKDEIAKKTIRKIEVEE